MGLRVGRFDGFEEVRKGKDMPLLVTFKRNYDSY